MRKTVAEVCELADLFAAVFENWYDEEGRQMAYCNLYLELENLRAGAK